MYFVCVHACLIVCIHVGPTWLHLCMNAYNAGTSYYVVRETLLCKYTSDMDIAFLNVCLYC